MSWHVAYGDILGSSRVALVAGANSLYALRYGFTLTPYSTLYLPSLRKQTKGVVENRLCRAKSRKVKRKANQLAPT